MSVHSGCDCLEGSLFIKKEFTHAKNIKVTQNFYESNSVLTEVNETEIKQEAFKIDRDSERTHFVKEEIADHENFNDQIFIDGHLKNKTLENDSFNQSYESNVKFQNKNFLCDLCNEKISDKKTLKKHCVCHLKEFENVDVTNIAGVHKSVKQYSCEIYEKSFTQRHFLKQHITSVHNNLKQYSCVTCEKVFSQRGNLKQHINSVHNNIKRYACDLCGKSFFEKSKLQQHIICVHNKTKPYSCEMCKKSFSSRGNLKQHISSVHNNVKQHSCLVCGKFFLRER